jgi:glycosyltransferase involved in cell wall biosynthesis/tetratricopeptide (TPR) repeat protein
VVRSPPSTAGVRAGASALRQSFAMGRRALVLCVTSHGGTEVPPVVAALAELEDTHLVVVGADSAVAERTAVVSEFRRVAGRVHTIKPVDARRLAAYIADADAGVVIDGPASGEAPPPSAYSFAAAGVPVVIAHGHARDDRTDELDAFVAADPQDPSDLARAIGTAVHRQVAPLQLKDDDAVLAGVYDAIAARPAGLREFASPLRSRWRLALTALRDLRAIPRGRRFARPRAFIAYAQGRLAAARGQHAIAARQYALARRRDPATELYLSSHAGALRDAGQTADAIRAYGELADSAPSSRVAAVAAVALARLGDRDHALELRSQLLERSGSDPGVIVRVAELDNALGDLSSARRSAHSALELAPDDRGVGLTALRVLEQTGDPSAALELARRYGDRPSVKRLEAVLQVYDPRWLPAVRDAARPTRAITGRTLSVLESSLPHATSGYTHRSRTLIAAQRAVGLDPVVATRLGFPASRRGRAAAVETVDGVVHHRAALDGVIRYTAVPLDRQLELGTEWIAGLARGCRPELLIAGTPHYNGLVALAVGGALKLPVIYDVRGFPEMTWAVRSGGSDAEIFDRRRAAETRCMREATVVTTLSETMRKHIVSRGVEGDRVHVLPHAVDVDALVPVAPDESLADQVDLRGRTVVGYVSSLVSYEGVETLLEAIALARLEDPSVAGLIVGDGPLLPVLEARARSLGIETEVRLTGRVPFQEALRMYSLIDIFVCPRSGLDVCRYVTPLKPFEAMAMGRCMVVSDLPALREAIGGGACGETVPPDDAPALAQILAELAGDPGRRLALAAAGREHVVAHHGLGSLRHSLQNVVEAVRDLR